MPEEWRFRKEWGSSHYPTGDIYQDSMQEELRKEWNLQDTDDKPYLEHIKDISDRWPHLRALGDFMEVGTDPLRWRDFHGNDKTNAYTYPENPGDREKVRAKRASRVKVCQLQYYGDKTVKRHEDYTDTQQLDNALEKCHSEAESQDENGSTMVFRLFVVEDLSRDVIERLGSHFDIDPDFFRSHIDDYVWFNVRDPFWNPPCLNMEIRRKSWLQLRFSRSRFFNSPADFNQGQDAANRFNVARKLYEDESKAFWDTDRPPRNANVISKFKSRLHRFVNSWLTAPWSDIWEYKNRDIEMANRSTSSITVGASAPSKKHGVDGKVGVMRTKASFWWKKDKGCYTGVMLLDPTIRTGHPLWKWYWNWEQKPSARQSSDAEEPTVPSFTRLKLSEKPAEPMELTGPTEQADPTFFNDFVYWAQRPDTFLSPPDEDGGEPENTNMVHSVPFRALLRLTCAEWLTLSQYIKTRLFQVDWEITHPEKFLTQAQFDSILRKLHVWRRLVPLYREMLLETKTQLPCDDLLDESTLKHYKDEFDTLAGQMGRYEQRIDRLTTVVTSAIGIADSRRVERITFLATLFVPLSLVGTLFSMSEDITQMGKSIGIWAATSVPLALAMLFLGARAQSGGAYPRLR